MQRRTAVTAYFSSEQFPLFAFARQSRSVDDVRQNLQLQEAIGVTNPLAEYYTGRRTAAANITPWRHHYTRRRCEKKNIKRTISLEIELFYLTM